MKFFILSLQSMDYIIYARWIDSSVRSVALRWDPLILFGCQGNTGMWVSILAHKLILPPPHTHSLVNYKASTDNKNVWLVWEWDNTSITSILV